MKNILLPIDLSENSRHAVKYALSLYENTTCNFYFLHTYTPAVYAYDYQLLTGAYDAEKFNSIHEATKENVANFVSEATNEFKNEKFEFHCLVECDILIEAVKKSVKEYDIDVIIMGTKGTTSSSKILFGSNTIQVINKRICPVIAVPENYEIKKPKDILFPTDLHLDYKDKHLDVLKDIAKNNDAKVHIFHVVFRFTSEHKKNESILEKMLDDVKNDFIMTEDKDIPVAINDYIKERPVDLLMMINNKHLFFENLLFRPVISNIAMDLKVPLLVVSA